MDEDAKDPQSTYLGHEEPLPEPATESPPAASKKPSAVVDFHQRMRERTSERLADDRRGISSDPSEHGE